jgi:hypothetical protein
MVRLGRLSKQDLKMINQAVEAHTSEGNYATELAGRCALENIMPY